ncbi:unknown [Mycoplasma sp. CAG:956]|nr:unknown [Mycoplasma sp. CAG:956]
MQKKKVNMIVLVVSVILMLIGLSYGYFLIRKNQENNNVAGSECFKLEFSNESEAINLSNMYPISDEEGKKQIPYSFTITNTCNMLAGYTVNMEMLEGTTLNSKYLDVLVNNEEIKLLSTYEATDTVIANSTESRVIAKGTLGYKDSVDYTVRFWMDKDVEDIESMNKYFASKIVVVATPSTWDSTSAGYNTLHDAILANEYQSTPEKAIEKIKAKGNPDLSQTAPIIKWVEKTGESTTQQVIKPAESAIKSDAQTSDLTDNDTKLKLYTTKTFNSNTGRYSMGEAVFVDPTTIDFNGATKYYYQNEYIQYNMDNGKLRTISDNGSNTIYLVTGVTKTSSTGNWNGVKYDAVAYKLSLTQLTETELETDKSDKGLYQAADDYGTTYYYRGNVKNNIVQFAGFYWQIVRINGDGSIRLMYDGTVKNATGGDQTIGNSQFNSKYNNPAYVGYMYGNPDGTTFDEVHNNTNNSIIKTAVDNWYKTNIVDKGFSSNVSNAVGFCGDRTLRSGDGVSTTQNSYFSSYKRLENNTPQFTCPELSRDLYTTAASSIGNKALTYPVGLITYDELVYAGMDNRHTNKLSWAYSTQHYWTMSPSSFDATLGYAIEWFLNSAGNLTPWWGVGSHLGARPVINLKSDTLITGGIGTGSDPFVVG